MTGFLIFFLSFALVVKGSYYIAKFAAMNEMAGSSVFCLALPPLPPFSRIFKKVSCQVSHRNLCCVLSTSLVRKPPSHMPPVCLCLLEFHAHAFLLKGNIFITLNHCFCFFSVDFNSDTTTLFCAFKTFFGGSGC
uniref:Secreted protein n=1 Tax=Rhipicephalus appendiculatus TaxID=34631 RepID=A0A131YFM0_RHIAP